MIDRRMMITAALAALASPFSTRKALAQAAMSRITAYAFSFPALTGGDIRLADYAGRPLLVVTRRPERDRADRATALWRYPS
jgi:glutathione peroxidase